MSGRQQTVAALDRAGIAHTGFPGEITYLRVRGLRVAESVVATGVGLSQDDSAAKIASGFGGSGSAPDVGA